AQRVDTPGLAKLATGAQLEQRRPLACKREHAKTLLNLRPLVVGDLECGGNLGERPMGFCSRVFCQEQHGRARLRDWPTEGRATNYGTHGDRGLERRLAAAAVRGDSGRAALRKTVGRKPLDLRRRLAKHPADLARAWPIRLRGLAPHARDAGRDRAPYLARQPRAELLVASRRQSLQGFPRLELAGELHEPADLVESLDAVGGEGLR